MLSKAAALRAVRKRRAQQGLSLVELLVGITIGMFIVAAAALVMSSQLSDNRKLLMEAQVQQDMRAASDIIARELRRTGHWGNAAQAVWVPGAAAVSANPYGNLSMVADNAADNIVLLDYFHTANFDNDIVDDRERSGFRVQAGAIQMLLGANNWQTLTDASTLKITNFRVTLSSQPVPLVCHATCVLAECPPVLQVRRLSVLIEGEAARDASVKRSVISTVRLHNDSVSGSCP